MPLLYLAKVNLNSNIYDVYDNTLDLNNVFELIYRTLNENENYTESRKCHYQDEYGNDKTYARKSNYSFKELKQLKNNCFIGKLIRQFNKRTEVVNENTGKVENKFNQESSSIRFYYDVENELIAFCERQSFGYIQFMNAFTHLLNAMVKKYKFEIYLQKDQAILSEKLQRLRKIERVSATVIPPNSNKDDLDELRNIGMVKDLKASNANQIKMVYKSDAMNMNSDIMKNLIQMSTRGYGEITVNGSDELGKRKQINSSKDAAFTAKIDEHIDEKGFIDEARELIKTKLGINNK